MLAFMCVLTAVAETARLGDPPLATLYMVVLVVVLAWGQGADGCRFMCALRGCPEWGRVQFSPCLVTL